MKTVIAGENIKTVCAISVSVEFSKEIAYWDKKYYFENPKFWEFWDSVNRKYRYGTKKYNIWRVGYQNAGDEKDAEQGKISGNYCRYLIQSSGHEKINISPQMNFILWHPADKFITTHEVGLDYIYRLMRDCAKFCGGTVEITYSSRMHYFQWDDVPTKTIVAGKGIKNYRMKEPKATKKCPEVKVKYKH